MAFTTVPSYLVALFFGFCLVPGDSIFAQSVPGEAPDEDVLEVQAEAHALFESGDYDRALSIYTDDLAIIGDKYAQYMVGYMYYSGYGVAKNHIIASAWYRLAAERGTAQYHEVSDQLLRLMDAQQRQLSDQMFAQLKSEYGDAVLMSTLITEDIEFMQQRVKSDPFNVDSLGRRNYDRKRRLYNEIATRVQQRVLYLREVIAADPSSTDADWQSFDQLNQAVIAEVRSLEKYNEKAPP